MLALAPLGLLINEKAGIVNLGAEGMMLCAAMAGFATVVHTGNSWLGFVAGMAAGALLAAIFGVLVIWLNTNQYATGLALSLFGVGFSAFAGSATCRPSCPSCPSTPFPCWRDLPVGGACAVPARTRWSMAPCRWSLALVWFLYRARAGLVLRSVGESPESAHALGYPVRRIRLGAVVAGGALCGLAGALHLTVYTPLWVEGMVAGRGWIALALTTFATWRPGARVAGCLPVWRGDHAAVPLAGHGRAGGQPVAVHAAVPGHHRGAGPDLAQPRLDSCEHARFAGQAVLPRAA